MNSPIAILIRKLRLQAGRAQHEFAGLLGYEQAYLSAIELGTKTPSSVFLAKLAESVEFSDQDRAELKEAIKSSKRRYVVPEEATTDTFRMCNELWENIDRLHPECVNGIRAILRAYAHAGTTPRYREVRIKRTNKKMEAQM